MTVGCKGDIPEGQRHAGIREVAIHISNHTMRREDRGVVVVGGSAELGDLAHQGAAGALPLGAVQPGGHFWTPGSLGARACLTAQS